jgi:hypothetical protein
MPGGRTGADGVVRLSGLDPSVAYELSAGPRTETFFDARRDRWTPADTTLRLERAYSVSGFVRSSAGSPLPTARVLVRSPHDGRNPERGADGSFRLEGLHRGDCVELAADVRGWGDRIDDQSDAKPAWTKATAGDTGVVLVVPNGPLLIVRTKDVRPGIFLARLEILLDGKVVKSIVPNLDGDTLYHVDGLDPQRRYTAWYHDADGRCSLLEGLAPDDVAHDLPFVKGAPLKGRVVLPEKCELPWVTAERDGIQVTVVPDADGNFEFPNLPKGRWRVSAQTEVGGVAWAGESVADAGETTTIELRRK